MGNCFRVYRHYRLLGVFLKREMAEFFVSQYAKKFGFEESECSIELAWIPGLE